MGKTIKVMVLDDEPIVCERLEHFLVKKGMEVETFQDSTLALKRLDEKQFDVVVTDLKMEGPTGMDVLRAVKKHGYPTEVIIITGYATFEKTREADYIGVFEFITKPFQTATILKLVKKAAKKAGKDK